MRAGIYAVGAGATVLGGITEQSVIPDSQIGGDGADDELYTRMRYLVAQNFAPTFSTLSIAAALTLTSGASVASLADMSGGLSFYAQKHEDGAARGSGSVHRKFTFAKGLLVPQTLSCQHQGDASLSFSVPATSSDGTTCPLVITDSSALAAIANNEERFTLGPIDVAGVTLTGVRSLQINFGIEITVDGADSDLYPTHASAKMIAPVITLSGVDAEWVKAANIPIGGTPATHANTAIYLRKRADGGTFVADATEEHVEITAAGYVVARNIFQGSGTDDGTVELELSTVYDGSNAPLVIDTTAALPA